MRMSIAGVFLSIGIVLGGAAPSTGQALHAASPAPVSGSPVQLAQAEAREHFDFPRLHDAAVDWCSAWSKDCGDGGALQFCQTKGFARATSWDVYKPGRTYVTGSDRYCNGDHCSGFRQVTCAGHAQAAVPAISSASQSQQRALLTRHVRDVVAKGRVKRVSPLPAEQHLQLAFTLPLRNKASLDTLLKDLYDPRSPSYGKYLTVQEFADRFGPSPEDYAAVQECAKASGMAVTGTSSNRQLIELDASAANVNKALHVNMGIYRHPTEDRTFYAPDREPWFDCPVPLWHIAGLDDFSPPRPVATGSAQSGNFLGSDIRAAYYGGTALTGSGQTIGLYGGGPFDVNDLKAYFGNNGQQFNPATVQVVAPSGFDTSCASVQTCKGETEIDIEQALSMAPGVDAVLVYEGPNSAVILNNMAKDNAKQLSSSFFWGVADPTEDDPYFKAFVAHGQTFLAASGDSGAYGAATNTGPSVKSQYPSEDPYVTAVGGTDLTTAGPGGAWVSESGWGGSGGGVNSNGIPIPYWQQYPGIISSANRGSTTLRNIPDVAAEANFDNYVCVQGTCKTGIAGTSFASPRWAGFVALINQQRAINGLSPIGFLNPTIYQIASSKPSTYSTIFHDTATGGNSFGNGSPGVAPGYPAVTGYDLATGLGSPTANLICYLGSNNPVLSTLVPSLSSVTVTAGDGSATGSNKASTTIVAEGCWASNLDFTPTLSISGVPQGVTATTDNSYPTTVTFTASLSAVAGEYPINIKTTIGGTTETVVVKLNVEACQPVTCASASWHCGSIPNGCGAQLQCGTCGAGLLCRGGNCINTCETATQSCPPPGIRNVDCMCITCPCGSFISNGQPVCKVCKPAP